MSLLTSVTAPYTVKEHYHHAVPYSFDVHPLGVGGSFPVPDCMPVRVVVVQTDRTASVVQASFPGRDSFRGSV